MLVVVVVSDFERIVAVVAGLDGTMAFHVGRIKVVLLDYFLCWNALLLVASRSKRAGVVVHAKDDADPECGGTRVARSDGEDEQGTKGSHKKTRETRIYEILCVWVLELLLPRIR